MSVQRKVEWSKQTTICFFRKTESAILQGVSTRI